MTMSPFKTTIDLKSDALRDELIQRAERMEARVLELANGADGITWPEGTARDTARFYARKMGHLDIEVAAEVLRVLVDEAEALTPSFWSTDLGRALFLLHAYPEPSVDRTMARLILGLRSRQHVHNLIVAGDLREDMGQMIPASVVRELFHVV
jgi:hypothetical protein